VYEPDEAILQLKTEKNKEKSHSVIKARLLCQAEINCGIKCRGYRSPNFKMKNKFYSASG